MFKFCGRKESWEATLKEGLTRNTTREEKMQTDAKMVYDSWTKLMMPWQTSKLIYWYFMSKDHSSLNTHQEYLRLGKDTTRNWN